jgi:hypothetical protein
MGTHANGQLFEIKSEVVFKLIGKIKRGPEEKIFCLESQ